jgi:cytochrome c oxidase subunit 3
MSTMSLSYNNKKTNTQKAQRFTMWLGIVSMAMSFGGWTSAFLVRKAGR